MNTELNLFYATLAGTPLMATPRGVNRLTLVKRVYLYLMATSIALLWVWVGAPTLQPVDYLVLAFGGYAAVSVFWSEHQGTAAREAIQLWAFLVMFKCAQYASFETVGWIVLCVGALLAPYVVFWKRQPRVTPVEKLSSHILGNNSAAGIFFMVAILLGIHLSPIAWPLIAWNMFGLIYVRSHLALLGLIIGCYWTVLASFLV